MTPHVLRWVHIRRAAHLLTEVSFFHRFHPVNVSSNNLYTPCHCPGHIFYKIQNHMSVGRSHTYSRTSIYDKTLPRIIGILLYLSICCKNNLRNNYRYSLERMTCSNLSHNIFKSSMDHHHRHFHLHNHSTCISRNCSM